MPSLCQNVVEPFSFFLTRLRSDVVPQKIPETTPEIPRNNLATTRGRSWVIQWRRTHFEAKTGRHEKH